MDTFSEHIVKEIEARGATPKPRWQFLLTRGVFWALAIASVSVGGIAFAVADFVFFDNDGISFATLRETPIQDIAQSIPVVWLLVLALFTASAYLGFRRTRKGYRYTTTLVVLAAIGTSVVLGLALNALDFGQTVHQYLLEHTDFYDPLIHSSEDTLH